jgi:uncharacterized protein (DUF1800 family)
MASLVAITGALGTDRAAHLLRRLTFGATRKEIDSFATKTITEALDILLAPQPAPAAPVDTATGLPWVVPGPDNSGDSVLSDLFRFWFYGQMYQAGATSTERLTFFLHTNFTGIISLSLSTASYFQNQLLRQFVFGNFKKLALKICIDNAMLNMLDNRLNENVAPNENYAREFFELFTIGKGPEIAEGNYTTYTEQDVRAAAKVLSGWDTDQTYSTIDPDTGLPTGKLKLNTSLLATKHDASIKTFSSAFNNTVIQPSAVVNSGGDDMATAAAAQQELSDLVEMIFAQKETARNICRKIYRFFVYYNITDDVEATVIGPMADLFYSNNYELKPVLELLFQSQHFFDADDSNVLNDTRGAIIKSPLEITIGMMRYFNVTFPDMYTNYASFYELASMVVSRMYEQGFDLYNPLDVSGYDAYFQAPEYNRNWISPNYLARRYQFASLLLAGLVTKDGTARLQLDPVAYIKDPANISDATDGSIVVTEFIKYLLPEPITTDRYNFFYNILLANLPAYEWTTEWSLYLSSGDDTGVRSQLNDFLSALLQSAEYQLS